MSRRDTIIHSLFLLLLFNCSEQRQWEGKVEYRDGYEVITNSGRGLYEHRTERLEIEWIVGEGGTVPNQAADLFAYVIWVDFDAEGNIYVLDRDDQVVTKLAPNGEIMLRFARKGKGPGELLGCDSFVWVDGRLYFANHRNGRIEVFTDYGESLPAITLQECRKPSEIFFSSDHFYVVESRSDVRFAIFKYDSSWHFVKAMQRGGPITRGWDILRNLNEVRAARDGFWLVYKTQPLLWKLSWDGVIEFKSTRELDWVPISETDGKIIPEFFIQGAADVSPNGNLYVAYCDPEAPKRIRRDVYKFGPDGKLHGKAFVLPIEKVTMIRFDNNGGFYFSNGIALFKSKIVVEE